MSDHPTSLVGSAPNRVTRAVLKKVSEGDRWRLELEQQSMLVGLIKTSTSQVSTATLIAICDQVAAPPSTRNRPTGVAGVAVEKIDPQIAIPGGSARWR
jgi:hypothetical protein